MTPHVPVLRRRRLARTACAAVALVAAASLAPAVPALAGSAKARPAVTNQFFGVHHQGMHADGPIGWPQTKVGSVRMWDNRVSWRELETSPGVFNWSLIDTEMAKARAAGASVLLVLGQTPAFHSSRPGAASAYGPGASAMPDKASWVRYVQAVARRNKTVWGGIASFQVWNEANVIGYWSGTPKQMATLTAWTRAALSSVSSPATLVAPALVTRLSSQQTWINSFYSQQVGGKNVSRYVDALSFQLYPVASGSPESSMQLLAAVRKILTKHGVAKPIWNTEVNYGMVGGPVQGAPITADRQVANVIRTYVLNAENGVSRVYWYSWDLQDMGNTRMVDPDRITLTPAGHAFGAVRTWLVGARPTGCTRASNGTYTCTFTTATQTRRVVWNPSKATSVTLPTGSPSVATWSTSALRAPGGSRHAVGPVPSLVTTPR